MLPRSEENPPPHVFSSHSLRSLNPSARSTLRAQNILRIARPRLVKTSATFAPRSHRAWHQPSRFTRCALIPRSP
ncbi:hypothetical protein CMV30_05645 [Nibricoccus aquaticus]|uniref:Uncharacterized protein n=1 Tax=Nibricoccus aquaticus TaxID=2576891 RepID=A0A290Q482_9BACT|nr:hypothetical protein CMV30_05645 [Nibricoccus aquaticus]